MKRMGQLFAGMAAVTFGGLVVSACAHDDSTMYIEGVLAPQVVQPGTVCVYTTDVNQTRISSGVLDVGMRSHYEAEFLLGNQTVQQASPGTVRTETDTINVQGAIVHLTDAAGVDLTCPTDQPNCSNFTRLAVTTIAPALAGVASYAPINVTIMGEGAVRAKVSDGTSVIPAPGHSQRIIAYVRFYGQTLGGTKVESNEMGFPVDVCNGCLDASILDPTTHDCPAASSNNQVSPCAPGEDLTLNCCAVFGHQCMRATP